MKKQFVLLFMIVFILQLKPLCQVAQDSVLLSYTNNLEQNWKPLPGITWFYVQLWGGGAGGNTEIPNMGNPQNHGGGAGGSYTCSHMYFTTVASFANGYTLRVGKGGDWWGEGFSTYFANSRTAGGSLWGQPLKVDNGSDDSLRYNGAGGGQDYYYLGTRYYGGGGGCGRTNGTNNEQGGQSAGIGFDGWGGTGIGGAAGIGNGGTGGNRGGRSVYEAHTPGGGGAGNQPGAHGEIRIKYFCEYSPGEIGNPHTVPVPAEYGPNLDFITNVEAPTENVGLKFSWEKSTDNVNWSAIPGSENQLQLAIPNDLQVNTWFRRVITNGCNPNSAANRSNVVKITVFREILGQKDGKISGYIKSINGTGVANIPLTAKKTINLKGSPISFVYNATTSGETGKEGYFEFKNIFYGDNINADPNARDVSSVQFEIKPNKPDHQFDVASKITELSNSSPTSINNNFIDQTVYAISGKITQTCTDCLDGNNNVTTITKGIGGVKISAGLGVSEVYSSSESAATLGNYAITVSNPNTYSFTPSYPNHTFSPVSKTVSVSTDIYNQDFTDNTQRIISGKLTDVAGNYIGTGTLIFQGVFENSDGLKIPTFKKRTTISANTGSFSITLPAGKNYTVSVESFTSAFAANDDKYISETDLKNFFNTKAIEPAIDIDNNNVVRNLVYHRPPVIVVTGLQDTTCNLVNSPGVVFKANFPRYFKIDVFEGPASLNHRIVTSDPATVTDPEADQQRDFIQIYTNVPSLDQLAVPETIKMRLQTKNGLPMLAGSMMGGAPNKTPPHKKTFQIRYTDKYGRNAPSQFDWATVTGVFNPTKTFTTAFPETPYLILHAPPGDASYSYWSTNSISENATTMAVIKDSTQDGFVNVSLGPKFSFEIGPISVEAAAIASLNTTKLHTVSRNNSNELVFTTQNTEEYKTSKSGVFDGTSGDVYFSAGINYKVGKSILVDFDPAKPANNCEVIATETVVMAPEKFRTDFAYSESHIKNVIIPFNQSVANSTTDPAAKRDALNQISIWQQVMDENKKQKEQAEFLKNRSFSNGVEINESYTSSSSRKTTITYDVTIGSELATELGVSLGGVGISGGAHLIFQQTNSSITASSTTNQKTFGYHLEDDDYGDYYSVDIKRDNANGGTYVFDLVAGTSSCPPELGAQNRDQPQIISGDMRFDNLPADTTVVVDMVLANKSESDEERPYILSADGNGLTITWDGVNLQTAVGIQKFIPANSSITAKIQVKKSQQDGIFSYPNVKFYLSDACSGGPAIPNSMSTATLSFSYKSDCGKIQMEAPLGGWKVNSASANNLPITMGGYTKSNISNITLEYAYPPSRKSSQDWKAGPVISGASVSSDKHNFNWNTASVKDSLYDIRLKLLCTNGNIIYSDIVSGIIDRSAPKLIGTPQPATRQYVAGTSEISFTYDEILDKGNLNNGIAVLKQKTSGTIIPVIVNSIGNKLIVTPNISLPNTTDSFVVTVTGVKDLNGNQSSKADTWTFANIPPVPPVYTGTNVAKVTIVNPVLAENASNKMELHFQLSEPATKTTKIYFNVSGTALHGTDYETSYTEEQEKICLDNNDPCISFKYNPVINQFIGNPGYINIGVGKTEAIFYIQPLVDNETEPSESIKVQLVQGSDYKLLNNTMVEGTIINFVPDCPAGYIMYVNKNATGANNGTSWTNAFKNLQDALAKKAAGCLVSQIWVAKGTYYPDEGIGKTNNDRNASFEIRGGINQGGFAIHGGFQGNEPPDFSLSNRNLVANLTVLSGDIDYDTQPDVVTGTGSSLSISNNGGNSYHVVKNVYQAPENVPVLTGFTIRSGNANGTGENAKGGGIYHNNVELNLQNCIVEKNASSFEGGGIYCEGVLTLNNCNFNNNKSEEYGGAIVSYPIMPYGNQVNHVIKNCSFAGNAGLATGGAIYIDSKTNFGVQKIENSTFTNNYSFKPGFNYGSAGAAFAYNHNGFPVSFTNCLFNGNKAPGTASGEGGGALMASNGPTTVTNCTFVNNQAVNGGALRNYTNGSFIVKNSIFWNNSASNGNDIIPGGVYQISNCILQSAACPGGATCGTGNLFNVNPQFADAANGNFRLSTCSPAIDAGNDADNTTVTDLAGISRKIDYLPNAAKIDMGAFELPLEGYISNVMYVNAAAAAGGNGSSWATAYQSLQTALAASNCATQEIWVAKGTYKPTTTTDRTIAFTMKNNLAVYGGFAGTETSLFQRNVQANPTILSGDIGTAGNNSDNSYNVVRNYDNGLNATAVLDGFTITGGNANLISSFIYRSGGGIHNFFTSPLIRNCSFTDNNAISYGGGVFNQGSAPAYINCIIAGNTASQGAGMFNDISAPSLTNLTMAGNLAGTATSGSLYNYGAVSPKITNTVIWGNNSGMVNSSATPVLTNNIVQTNTTYLPQDSIFRNKPVPGLGNMGDLRLRACSPAVNAGNSEAVGPVFFDIAGNNRIIEQAVDLGAYERVVLPGEIIYVDINATGKNDGTSWENAFTGFNDALGDLNLCLAAGIATRVQVAKGTYTMPASTNAIFNKLNAVIVGGYPTGGGTLNPAANQVIIKGNVRALKSLQIENLRISN